MALLQTSMSAFIIHVESFQCAETHPAHSSASALTITEGIHTSNVQLMVKRRSNVLETCLVLPMRNASLPVKRTNVFVAEATCARQIEIFVEVFG